MGDRTAWVTLTIDDEATFEGVTIPTRVRAGWRPETDKYQEFARFAFDAARFR